MRRIAPLAALVAVALPSVLAACDDAALPSATGATIALGTLPSAAVTATPTDASTTSEGGSGETAPASTADRAPASTEATSTTDGDTVASTDGDADPARPTRFVVELDALVEDEPPVRLATSTLRDDTGRLRLDVPRDWTDRRTEPSRLPDGRATPAVAAAPDLTSFLDGYDDAGLTALVVGEEPADALDAYEFAADCIGGRGGEYHGEGATGRYEVWESCGGTINDIVTVAVRPDDASGTVLLLVQVVDAADLAALDVALESLMLDD